MLALVREVSRSIAHCELTYLPRAAIDVDGAIAQHARYVEELAALGCRVEWLPPLAAHADGVFVEDTAVLVPELAVITRPGAASRRAEVDTVARALEPRVPLYRVTEPASLEGGDVLQIGRAFYVGASARSNAAGVTQLAAALAPHGYEVRTVALQGCLHLKSACTLVPPDTLVVNPDWVDPAAFGVGAVVAVDAQEPYGANTLTIAGVTLISSAYPRTRERLEAAGIATRTLEVAELHKAEAALTCMSLLLEPARRADA
jgi:dimethylargininase